MTAEVTRIIQEQDIANIVAKDLPWSELSGERVLVTGAGGFLGGYLTRTLLSLHRYGKVQRAVHVTALVRSSKRARARLADILMDPQLEIRESDLSSIARIDLRGFSYVLHAASQASPRFYRIDPVGTLLPNTVGTAALLEGLKGSSDARGMLFVSSSEVYGEVADDVVLDETAYGFVDPTAIRACYAEAKRFGEALCAAWHHQYKIPTYIVRPFHTYGPGLQADDGRVFADFAFNVIRGENIVIRSDGCARRAFCYVSDAIAGFFTVLLTGEPATAYNVANAAGELSVKELAELLISLYPEKKLSIQYSHISPNSPYLPSTQRRVVPNTSRLCGLGWHAEVCAEVGFRRMIEAYRSGVLL